MANCDKLKPFATIKELALYWRPMDSDEEARATVLINYASARLRVKAKEAGVDLDAKITADETGSYAMLAQGVICSAVKRAICTPSDTPPVETFSQTAGPYSESLKYVNPGGDLFFTKKELKELGIYGSNRMFSITPKTEGDIYGNEML